MSQIENNPENIVNNNINNSNISNSNNNNNSNSNNNSAQTTQATQTTHYRGRNININFMKEMFKKNAVLYIAILFAILATGLLLSFSTEGTNFTVYNGNGYNVNYDSGVSVFDFVNFAFFTAMIITVVPVVLSITLFSWVFKRKKVDFIASMPLNKRTICISNTLLGVAFIFVSDFLYVSSVGLGCVVSGKMFFMRQFLEAFLYILLATLFLFGICNLAMSKAGNIVTQIVLVILILFLIPTGVKAYQYQLECYSDYTITGDYRSSESYSRNFTTNYLPIPLNTVYGEKDNYISAFKVGESLLYIVAIYGLTQFLFEHRNMEENQESFKNTILHEIVKGATMLIILAGMFISIFDEDLSIPLVLLFIIISLVYFVIYDFITAKKVKMSITVVSLLCTYAVSFVFGLVYWELDENFKGFDKTTDVSAIESITFSSQIEIKDKEFINEFMNMVFREDELSERYFDYTGEDDYYDYDDDDYSYQYDAESELDDDTEEDSALQDVSYNQVNYSNTKLLRETSYYTGINSTSICYKIKLKNGEVLDSDYLYINSNYLNQTLKKYISRIQDSIIEDFEKNSGFWGKINSVGVIEPVEKSVALSGIRNISTPQDLLRIIKSYGSIRLGESSYCGFYLYGPEVYCVDFK